MHKDNAFSSATSVDDIDNFCFICCSYSDHYRQNVTGRQHERRSGQNGI